MAKKYEFTGETTTCAGVVLKGIRRISDGEVGGWIEGETNLSHEGECWVSGNGRVYGNASVCENAQVAGSAVVIDNAVICGNARVSGNASVYGNARVCENAQVFGNAYITDSAQVYGNARVYEYAQVYGSGQVYGNARVYGNAQVYGEGKVTGNGIVCNYGRVDGNALVYGDGWVKGTASISQQFEVTGPNQYINITGYKYDITIFGKWIAIGCQCRPVTEWRNVAWEDVSDELSESDFIEIRTLLNAILP